LWASEIADLPASGWDGEYTDEQMERLQLARRAQGASSELREAKDSLRSWLKDNDPTYWSWVQGIGLTGIGNEEAVAVGYRTDEMPPILAPFAQGQRWQGFLVRVESIGEIYAQKTSSGPGLDTKFRYEPGDEVGIGGGTRTVHAVVVQDNGATVTVNNSIDELAPPGGQVFTVDRSRVHPSAENAIPYAGKRAQGPGEGPGLGMALAVGLGAIGVVGLAAYLLSRKGPAFGATEYTIGLEGSAHEPRAVKLMQDLEHQGFKVLGSGTAISFDGKTIGGDIEVLDPKGDKSRAVAESRRLFKLGQKHGLDVSYVSAGPTGEEKENLAKERRSHSVPLTIDEFIRLDYDDTFTYGELRGAFPKHARTGLDHHTPDQKNSLWARYGYDDALEDFADWYKTRFPTEQHAKKSQRAWVRLFETFAKDKS